MWTCKLLPEKSNADRCDITDARRRRTAVIAMSFWWAATNIPPGTCVATLMLRPKRGCLATRLIELMATSEKFFRIFLFWSNMRCLSSGRSSSSLWMLTTLGGGSMALWSPFTGGLVVINSMSTGTSIRWRLMGWRSMDPNVACRDKALRTRRAPRNPNASRRTRTSWGRMSMPTAVPAIDRPTAWPRFSLK